MSIHLQGAAKQLSIENSKNSALLDFGMTFHTKAGNIYMLIIDTSPVSYTTFTKSLVVYIDHNLCWNVHVDNLSKKIASGIGMLTLLELFFHLILSKI